MSQIPRKMHMRRMGPNEMAAPRYARPGDSGLDLAASLRPGIWCRTPSGHRLEGDEFLAIEGGFLVLKLPIGASAVVPCGWAFEIPPGFEGQVRGRSGWTERRIYVATATIDSNYRGEVCFCVWNQSGATLVVRTGDRLAQLIIAPVATITPEVVLDIEPSVRGEAGFGSSDER